MRLAALLVLLLAACAAHAQPEPGTCRTGVSEDSLTVNDVAARVFNTGSLFFGNTTTNGTGYLVPKDTGRSPVFAASLWLGGTVGGQLRVAGATYSGFSFWPGPLSDDARPIDPSDCSAYDRIYTVSRADVAAYYATGRATDNLRDWPYGLGAPVLDGDGVAGNYNLAGGDQPAVRGDETAWWVMNDVGGPHSYGTPPMGVEVRVEAFALARVPLHQTTFYRYTFTNRTAETIDSVYTGLWTDTDLGGSSDDYLGSDTTASMGYTYNADDSDLEYGVPPAFGVQVAEGPIGYANGRDDDGDGATDEPGERLGMTAAMQQFDGCTFEACNGAGQYRFMRGLWGDGSVVRERGFGYEQPVSAPVTTFSFNGDPVLNRPWSEVNPGPGLPPSPTYERRFVTSTGPFRLLPGQSETVLFALPFAQGTTNLDSITRLRGVAAAARAVVRAGALDPVRVDGTVPVAPPDQRISLSVPSPNPFTDRASVTVRAPSGTAVRATLHDVLGRVVAVLHDGPTGGAETEVRVPGAGLAPGVYLVRVVVPAGERTVPLFRR